MSRFRTIRSYNMGSQADFAMAHKFGENEAAKAQGITKKIMKAGRGELSKDELDVLKSEIDDSCSILSRGRGKDAFQRALGKVEGVFEQKNGKHGSLRRAWKWRSEFVQVLSALFGEGSRDGRWRFLRGVCSRASFGG